MSYENPWLYNGEIIDLESEDYVGFVYLITNLTSNKKYIGKKLFKFTRSKKIKGKKKRVKIDSDWKEYYGSSKDLLVDLNVDGVHESNFKREILRLCKTKSECNYWEAKYQFENKVLESDEWYNSWISVKVHKAHVKI